MSAKTLALDQRHPMTFEQGDEGTRIHAYGAPEDGDFLCYASSRFHVYLRTAAWTRRDLFPKVVVGSFAGCHIIDPTNDALIA